MALYSFGNFISMRLWGEQSEHTPPALCHAPCCVQLSVFLLLSACYFSMPPFYKGGI